MDAPSPPPFGSRYPPARVPPRAFERVGRAITRLGLRLYFGAQHVGREHIPSEGPAILVSNHPTVADPFTVAFGTPRWVSWMAFDEAFDWPFFGAVMRLYRAIPLNLERPRPSSIKAAYGTLARGRVLGLFFEGERSHDDGLNRPLKPGAARMAIRTGATLVPVTISGARRVWPRQQRLPRPGKIVVRYHPPVDPRAFRPELPLKERSRLLTEELARIVASALPPDGAPWLDRSAVRPDRSRPRAPDAPPGGDLSR